MQFINKAAAAAVFVLACAAALPARAECEFKKLGEMAVDMSHGQPRVQIEANGQKRWVVLVTGSSFSSLRKADIAALGGGGRRETGLINMTKQGEQRLQAAALTDVILGDAFRIGRLEVLVSDDGPPDSEIAGVIGADILAASDVEFDFAHNRVAFFSPNKDCSKSNLGYWEGAITQTDLVTGVPSNRFVQAVQPHFRPQVVLDGHPVTAELSSASGVSLVDTAFARVQGLKPGAPGVDTVIAPNGKPILTAKFQSFAIGGEKINNPTFTLQDLWANATSTDTGSNIRTKIDGLPPMVLGLDFMRSHRILVANSQHKMYVSYNGGAVFRTPTSK
jgi:hypothetical protein